MSINNILPFACAATSDAETQAAYAADGQTATGFVTGTALTAKVNKVWRQTSAMAYVVAQFICDGTGQDVIDADAPVAMDVATILANFKKAVGLITPQPTQTSLNTGSVSPYVPPPGCKRIVVRMVAPGGANVGATAPTNSSFKDVTAIAGSNGVGNVGTNAGPGGAGGTGGSAGTGTVNQQRWDGQAGDIGDYGNATSLVANGGHGGSSVLFGGGGARTGGAAVPNTGGGASGNSSAGGNGGSGGGGAGQSVTFQINQPLAANYAFVVGVGHGGASNGYIIVDEYYS